MVYEMLVYANEMGMRQMEDWKGKAQEEAVA